DGLVEIAVAEADGAEHGAIGGALHALGHDAGTAVVGHRAGRGGGSQRATVARGGIYAPGRGEDSGPGALSRGPPVPAAGGGWLPRAGQVVRQGLALVTAVIDALRHLPAMKRERRSGSVRLTADGQPGQSAPRGGGGRMSADRPPAAD